MSFDARLHVRPATPGLPRLVVTVVVGVVLLAGVPAVLAVDAVVGWVRRRRPAAEELPGYRLSNLRVLIHEAATPMRGHDAVCCARAQAGDDEYVEAQVAADLERQERR